MENNTVIVTVSSPESPSTSEVTSPPPSHHEAVAAANKVSNDAPTSFMDEDQNSAGIIIQPRRSSSLYSTLHETFNEHEPGGSPKKSRENFPKRSPLYGSIPADPLGSCAGQRMKQAGYLCCCCIISAAGVCFIIWIFG